MESFKTPDTNKRPVISRNQIDFTEYTTSNGLQCIIFEDKRNPIVSLTIGYKVGSKDEVTGKKGIAHLFEHMMFQGSANVKKNEHFEYVMKSGGVSNAFTMHDITAYYCIMPSNNLETALWLESDRMDSLEINEENLANQKSVVIEEKNQINNNAPYGMMFSEIFFNVFKGSNYESPVIGFESDINSFTVKEAQDFHKKFYSPGNSVLIAGGNLEINETTEMIEKYFSGINKSQEIKRNENKISPLQNDMEKVTYDNIQLPAVNICYQLPEIGSREYYIFEYLSEMIANNKSSRLYRKLVYEKKIVKSVKALKFGLEDKGILIFRAMLNPDQDPDLIIGEIQNEIENFAINGCSDEEFQKIKNQIEFQNLIKYLRLQNIGIETAFNFLYYKDASRINSEVDKYLSVNKNDVIDSVNEFILKKNKFILKYLPKKLN